MISEFTELKNDGACDYYENNEARIAANCAISEMEITCPKC